MTTFGERIHAAMAQRGPFCVGIDPHPSLLAAWGLSDDPAGLDQFSRTVVEALGDTVAVFKPQSAFFERHGSRGVAVLETVIAEARAAGALVIVDAKRGDIGSTMQAYADAYVDPASPLCADAVTASPFLGFESLRPLIDTALAHGNGVFVLARTSNPEGTQVQAARGADGQTVAGAILDQVRAANAGTEPLGSIGAVVGVTGGPTGENLRIGGPLLALGIGAQGASIDDLPAVFGAALPLVLPAVSRGVLRAGPAKSQLRQTTASMVKAVRDLLFRPPAQA